MSNGDIPTITLDPYLASVLAVLDALQAAGLIPNLDPLQFIFDAFDGKPKLEDTEQAALRLQASPYWPLQALGANLQIWVRNGVPLSTGDLTYRAQLSDWIRGTISNIESIAYGRFNPYSLDHAIWLSMTSEQGDTAIQNLNATIAAQIALGPLPQVPPGPPPPPPPPLALCAGTDPSTDEILDSCIATQTSLAAIVAAIQALGNQTPPGTVDPCCTAVVSAIGNVTSQLANITALLAALGGPGPPIDLSGILEALKTLAAAVAAYPPALEACCAAVSNQLGGIANAIKNATGADVSGIVTALQNANTLQDVPSTVLETLQSIAPLDPAAFGQLQGSPFTTAKTVLDWIAKYDPANVLSKAVFGWIHNHPEGVAELKAAVTSFIQTVFSGALASFSTIFQPFVTALLHVHSKAIANLIDVQPGDETRSATELLTEAISSGVGAHFAAVIAELAYPTKNLGMPSLAALMSELAGFAEIMRGIIGVEVRQAVALPHTYTINNQARALLPPMGQALALMARRKISQAQAETLLGYAGLNRNYVTAMENGAYRPVQPRTLVQLFLDQPIDQTQLTAMLQDTALSDANVRVMADAITYKSISNVRNSYLSALISGYQKGVVGDDEVNQALADFNFSPQAQQYVRAHVLILRREVLAAETEKQIVPQIVNGIITPEAAQQQLEVAGVQPWYAELIAGLAAVRAEIAVTKKELKAEEKLEAKRQTALQRTALADFANGTLDAAGLGATLIAAGLDPVIATAVVAEKTATRSGRLRLLYKQLLLPADAKLLEERIGAITAQLKEQLINYQQALAQIKALGVDNADANAIVARTAAAIAAASTVGALINPLTGQPG